MIPKTIGTGVVLVGVGFLISLVSDSGSITSWIPAFWGGAFIIFGVLAMVDSRRSLAMHLAALVALLGVVGGIGSLIGRSSSGWAAVSQLLLAGVCGGYLVIAVQSFRAARAARAVS